MFTVSDGAILAIRRLTTLTDAPPRAGLRIAPGDAAEDSLRLSLTAQPYAGDRLHETDDTGKVQSLLEPARS